MKNLNELLAETQYTNEEWQTYEKVEKNCQLKDLKFTLEDLLENGRLTQEQYDKAYENAGWIIEKYNKWLEYDWQLTMYEAIGSILDQT